jgi:hypothetical protein
LNNYSKAAADFLLIVAGGSDYLVRLSMSAMLFLELGLSELYHQGIELLFGLFDFSQFLAVAIPDELNPQFGRSV